MSLSRRLANLGKAIDSATTGHFLSKGDSDGVFETIQYSDLTGRPTVLDSANITSLIDSAYIQLRQTSAGSGGLDSAAITNLVDSAYVSARSPAAASGFAAYEYNTSAAQTTFQDSDVNGNVLSYTANGIIVYYNGVLMPTSDYTATDGSSVVFTTAVDSGGTVTIAKWALASSGGSGAVTIPWGGTTATVAGGDTGSYGYKQIDYFAIATPGNAADFGDLTTNRGRTAGNSSGDRGVYAGGYDGSTYPNTIDYITFATPGNATDFGDLISGRYWAAPATDGTTGAWAGGRAGSTNYNRIDYVTLDTAANASDWGDTLAIGYNGAGGDNGTYGLFAGIQDVSAQNVIQYITWGSTGNAVDFGDLTRNQTGQRGVSDETYVLFTGGNGNIGTSETIQVVTAATPSNASTFGDLSTAYTEHAGKSTNGTYGIIAGGRDGLNSFAKVNNIEYITIATSSNSVDFGDLTIAKDEVGGCAGT